MSIKNVYHSTNNILVVDVENKVYVCGDNTNRITGFGVKNIPLYCLQFTEITLDDGEDIVKFHSANNLLSFSS